MDRRNLQFNNNSTSRILMLVIHESYLRKTALIILAIINH